MVWCASRRRLGRLWWKQRSQQDWRLEKSSLLPPEKLAGEETQSWQERRLRVDRRGESELAGEETQSWQERRLRVGRRGDSKATSPEETCVERDS